MKKITGLNDKVEYWEDVPEGGEFMVPTYRQIFMKQIALGAARPDQPEDTITLYELGSKIKNSTLISDIDIEDSDFKLLAEVIRKNPAGYINHYHAQVLKRLKTWEGNKN